MTIRVKPGQANRWLILVFLTLGACGGRPYIYESYEATSLVSRAKSQSDGQITVRASVPGEEEVAEIFGVPLHDNDVQPVWLEVTNSGDDGMRYALVGTDRYYFSPLEVAWKHRGPFSKEARLEMEKRFDGLAMPRHVGPGETVSGFVFTNLQPGIKVFNVDLFGDSASYDFTFLLDVPGFRPDYADIDFENLYDASDFADVDADGLRHAIENFGCCPTNAEGTPVDSSVNVALVGEGIDLLKSLLRGNWRNLSSEESAGDSPSFLFGRRQDATFRYQAAVDNGYYEIRLWLAPIRVDGKLVWAGEVKHVIQNAWSVTRRDPDVDNARGFLLQNMWYSQSLSEYGLVRGQQVVAAESIWAELFDSSYFTDGYRAVLWLSGDPVSLADTRVHLWEESSVGPNE